MPLPLVAPRWRAHAWCAFQRASAEPISGRMLDVVEKYRAAILPALSRVRAGAGDFPHEAANPAEFR